MSKEIKIGGRLYSVEQGNVVAGANAILDDTKGKKQSVINSETDAELSRLDEAKQNVLTFDNAPTENSNNPVKSGGVYAADAALQQSIEAILALIPSAATALNQLADKAFVNSTVATNTATFRGTYNVVTDLSLHYNSTHQEIATALLSVVQTADNNDYCFVQIPVSDSSDDIRVTERYKFNGTVWSYEYDLNNSGFTADQWAAINSTITLALVQKLGALPTAAELAQQLATKQNTLTFDAAPVAGSDNPVKSGGLYNVIAAINATIPSGASVDNKLVTESRLTQYVAAIVGALDATFNVTSTDGHVNVRLTQVDGVITSVEVLTNDIASAAALNTLAGRVTTNEGNISLLQAAYNALQQSAPVIVEPTDTWPVANPSATVIYRVIDRVNTPPQYYSDYMWNGTAMVLMATYNNAIDPRPKKCSQNLVTSGGVFDNMGALDVSELNAKENPHTLVTYADLSAALAAIPSDYQKGGMSIKFVHSSDNKYVQYRLMSDSFNTTVSNWQGIDDVPTAGSENLVKSGGVYDNVKNVSNIKEISGADKKSLSISDENRNVILRLQSGLFVDNDGNIITDIFDSRNLFTLQKMATSDYDFACAKRQMTMPIKMIENKVVDKFNRLVVSFNGDSVLGSQLDDITHTAGYDTGVFPPNMSKNIMAKMFLDRYQFANADVQYRNIIHSDWVKSSGAFEVSLGKDDGTKTFNEIEVYGTANTGDSAEITVTGYSFFKLIWSEYRDNKPFKFQVLCSIDGGAYAPINGISEYIEHTNDEWCMLRYSVIAIDSTKTYKFKVIATEHPEDITFWGCEYWNNKRLDVVMEAYSGSTALQQVDKMLAGYCSEWHKPAFVITDLLCSNDQPWIESTDYTLAKWQQSNATIMKRCLDNGIPVLVFVPHTAGAWLVKAAAGYPYIFNLPFIDIQKILVEDGKTYSDITQFDGAHLSNYGNQYYFETIKKIFG